MDKIAIRTERLGKKYRLGTQQQQKYTGYDILGFELPLQRLWPILFNDPGTDIDDQGTIWALRELDLEVRPGEVVGVVGRNGSGKSTLLKILARVTEPSTGFADVAGQVGSLLEVGTGFHPELTGRQNVYLNGSIMGMTSEMITRRLDEIVGFAEVEQFIDTPVKRYSSGMYMRLAFSVASHMECDILLVDEVLAVGDAQFQNKCLRRLESEVKQGKTVLFVSHNSSMIMQVCTRCILFEHGRLTEDGLPQPVIERYLSRDTPLQATRVFADVDPVSSTEGNFRLSAIRVTDGAGTSKTRFDVTEPIVIVAEWNVLRSHFPLEAHLALRHESGVTAFVSFDDLDSPWCKTPAPVGRHHAHCVIPADFLNEGIFKLDFTIAATTRSSEYVSCVDAATFQVVDELKTGGVRGNSRRPWPSAVMRPRLRWTFFDPEPFVTN
jgi:lipopolysaccharide transport system ATP-binding protein